jgi:hypothetical protein
VAARKADPILREAQARMMAAGAALARAEDLAIHDQVEEECPDPASTWEPTEASQALYSNSSRPAVSGRGA